MRATLFHVGRLSASLMRCARGYFHQDEGGGGVLAPRAFPCRCDPLTVAATLIRSRAPCLLTALPFR